MPLECSRNIFMKALPTRLGSMHIKVFYKNFYESVYKTFLLCHKSDRLGIIQRFLN